MEKKMVYKLIDKSLILGTCVEETDTTVTVKQPFGVTQSFNPQTGQPEVVMIPMDLIFSEASDDKNVVTLKKEHIMYEKDMADFPPYEQNYRAQTTGVETVGVSGVIKV